MMKKFFLFTFIALFCFNLFGCSSNTKNVTNNSPQVISTNFNEGVDIIIEPKVIGGKVTVSGKTNLPDGTELMVGLGSQNPKYAAGGTVRVANGAFNSPMFTNKGNALTSGSYNFTLQSPSVRAQSGSVRSMFGDKGKNLKGKYVVYSEAWQENIIFFKSVIEVK